MGKKRFLNIFAAFAIALFSAQQTGSIPESIRRPEPISVPEYPLDLSIGKLGAGEAVPEAYNYARRVLNEAQQGRADSASFVVLPADVRKEFLEQVAAVSPRKCRIGGGREELDGSTTFLFRYIGREQELAGEIYMRAGEDGVWKLEDIIAEDRRDISAARESDHPYSYIPYDRFW
ncbi:MAG: hypothetical protein LBG79_06460 [Spirochaetaceae bacterium]|jgi:hypothetical protein|nr:hypothetical protein [Spirochaetaceae bacterium]GMO17668.1 MAG: hypothetical protein Pg6A_04210 [Termitinemataceae bacterium]